MKTLSPLLKNLFALLEAHRPAFTQERVFLRALGLFLSEIFVFGRHTVTQGLLALGLIDADWSSWYRLFSLGRFVAEKAAAILLVQTLPHVPEGQPYVAGTDGVGVPRTGHKMPGTAWLPAPFTAPFRRGLQRLQRFVDLAWLTPLEEGYSRAIPLLWLPAFTRKAISSAGEGRKEWEVALEAARWLRAQLDAQSRKNQWVLLLVDGALERGVEFWRGLPERLVVLGRTARNRVFYHLPNPEGKGKRGAPQEYGERAFSLAQWLRERKGWSEATLRVRGREMTVTYRVEGPFLREGLPDQPLFLLVVRGCDRKVGKGKKERIRRPPAFFVVSAIREGGEWRLLWSAEFLLTWAWQRWELEVEHREVKSGLGLGEKQCWNPRSAVVSVQWSAWVYGVLLLAGYRTWGLCRGPASPGRWWRGSRRWSLNTLLRGLRTAWWEAAEFRTVWPGITINWVEKEVEIASLWNTVVGTARI